ncbi:MAG: SGNH/GDSL hydrolase family protein [Planctomycetes bacterium]|nr:SGNH/GDSL hydrolase family protein [Planctomycetota bacterium]
MRKRSLLVFLATLLTIPLVPGVASAENGEDPPIYLSLGTSLSAGTLADVDGISQPFTNKSFTDRLYPRLRKHFGGQLEHVKLGCPGETSNSMMTGMFVLGADDPPDGNAFMNAPTPSVCSDSGPFPIYASGTQLGDALATLDSERVELVTIDMGANDALRTLNSCGINPTCIEIGLGFSLVNLQSILVDIRAVYSGPIIGMTYYNPNLAAIVNPDVGTGGLPPEVFAAITNQLTADYNNGLEAVYGAFGVTVADVETAFDTQNFGDADGNGVPDNVDMICALTDMCPSKPGASPNIHPNPKGYLFISRVFLAALG